MNKLIITFALAALAFGAVADETGGTRGRGRRQPNPEAKLHRFSTTVEKERPKLNQETKDLIAAYRRDPSDANRAALRRQVAANYDAVVARKKAKLEGRGLLGQLLGVDVDTTRKRSCGQRRRVRLPPH